MVKFCSVSPSFNLIWGFFLANFRVAPKCGTKLFGRILALIAACFCQLTSVGVPTSLMVYFLDWLEAFDAGRGVTSLIQSIAIGLTFGSGLVCGMVVKRFGERLAIVAGAFISAVGFLVSFFATNVIFLIITIGVLSGVGNCLMYLGIMVSATKIFPRRVNFMLIILLAAAGAGGIVGPYTMIALKEFFGWRGSFLILCGIYLNCVAAGLVVTSITNRAKTVISVEVKDPHEITIEAPTNTKSEDSSTVLEEVKSKDIDDEEPANIVTILPNSMKDDIGNGHPVLAVRFSKLPEQIEYNKNNPVHVESGGVDNLAFENDADSSQRSMNDVQTEEVLGDQTSDVPIKEDFVTIELADENDPTGATVVRELMGPDHVPQELEETEEAPHPHHEIMLNIACSYIYYETPSGEPLSDDDFENLGCASGFPEITRIPLTNDELMEEVASMYEEKPSKWGFLRQPIFIIVMLAAGFAFPTINNVLIATTDYVENRLNEGESSASIFILVTNAFEVLACLGVGVLRLSPRIHSVTIVCGAGLLASGAAVLLAFSTERWMIFLGYSLHGMAWGGIEGSFPVAVLELVGADYFTLALGLVCTFNGIGSAAGGFITGQLFDITQSYQLPYLLYAGACAALVLILLVVFIMRWLLQRRNPPTEGEVKGRAPMAVH